MSTVLLSPTAADVPRPASAAPAQAVPGQLTTLERYGVAGAGALAPLLAKALLVDTRTVFAAELEAGVVLGYVLRVLLLFAAGAVAAYLYRDEHNRAKLFQLGLAAPAMITALVTGTNVRASDHATAAAVAAEAPALSFALVTPLYAQQQTALSFNEPPAEGLARQVWRGFSGGASHRGEWFVYVRYVFPTPGPAFAYARHLEGTTGFQARVYRPDGPVGDGYVVVIGDWISQESAVHLAAEAEQRKIPAVTWSRPAKGD